MIDLATLAHVAATTTTTVAKKSSGGSSIFAPIAKPIADVMAAIYSVIPNYGVTIIGVSLLWMIIIAPLTLKSTRSMLAMQKLQPQLKKLQEQHKGDKQAFAQAQMELFREHQVSPFGSCLPMLLPLPVFFALYRVIEGLSHTVTTNGRVVGAPYYLSPQSEMYKAIQGAGGHLNAFGMNLADNAFSPHNGFLGAAPYWIVLLLMAATSYMQSAMMMSRNTQAQNNPQMRLMKYLPLVFVLICVRFPAGLIVYYVVSNIARIVQQDAMYRFDPRVKALVAKEVEEVEELTHEIDAEEREKRGKGYTPPRSARQEASPKPPAARPGGGTSGARSRFRDLLAAAAEQQKAQPPRKPPQPQPKTTASGGRSAGSKGGAPPGNGASSGGRSAPGPNGAGTGANGTGASRDTGAGKSGSGPTKSGAAPADQRKNRPSGSRTNRKRRGR